MTATERGLGLADQSGDAETTLAWFRRMRKEDPVSHDEQAGVWHVFRYADAQQILADPDTFSSDFSDLTPPRRTSTSSPGAISSGRIRPTTASCAPSSARRSLRAWWPGSNPASPRSPVSCWTR